MGVEMINDVEHPELFPKECTHCAGTGNAEKDPAKPKPCTDKTKWCKPCRGGTYMACPKGDVVYRELQCHRESDLRNIKREECTLYSATYKKHYGERIEFERA